MLFLAVCLAAPACVSGPEWEEATLFVKVRSVDAETDEPLAGMRLRASDASVPERITDEEGRASFEIEGVTVDGRLFGGAFYTVTDPDGRFETRLAVASNAQLDPDAPEVVLEHVLVCDEPPCAE
jgi:hypothetical protein